MKLGFPPIRKGTAIAPLAADFAVMLVGVAARQATSPTAVLAHDEKVMGTIAERLLEPGHGAFNRAVAADLKRWKETTARRSDA